MLFTTIHQINCKLFGWLVIILMVPQNKVSFCICFHWNRKKNSLNIFSVLCSAICKRKEQKIGRDELFLLHFHRAIVCSDAEKMLTKN